MTIRHDRTLAVDSTASSRSAKVQAVLTTGAEPLGFARFVLPLGLSLLCLRSLFHHGYLLELDISFGPRAWPVGWAVAAPGLSAGVGSCPYGRGRCGREALRGRRPVPCRLRAYGPVSPRGLVCAVRCRLSRGAEPIGLRPDGRGAVGCRGRRGRTVPLARSVGDATAAPELRRAAVLWRSPPRRSPPSTRTCSARWCAHDRRLARDPDLA